MFTIRKKLSATEGTDPNTRYDDTCECVQSTFDGGATWVDNPAADPRTSPLFLNPGSDDKCYAAQGVANFVAAFLDGAYQAFNIVGISSWAIQIGFFFTPLGLFYKIALIVADGLINIGSITLQATFDSDTYDAIRDIAYCYLNDDGKFDDQAAFDAFGAKLQEEIGGSAFNITMALMFNLYGWVGFSNAALEYAEIADCSGANCSWGYLWDYGVDEGDTDYDSSIAYVGGHWNGIEWAPDLTGHSCSTVGNYYDLGRRTQPFDIPSGTVIEKLILNHTVQNGNACNHLEMWLGADRTGGLAETLKIYTVGAAGNPSEATGTITGGVTGRVIGFGTNSYDGSTGIQSMRVEGTGDMPNFTGGTPYTP